MMSRVLNIDSLLKLRKLTKTNSFHNRRGLFFYKKKWMMPIKNWSQALSHTIFILKTRLDSVLGI